MTHNPTSLTYPEHLQLATLHLAGGATPTHCGVGSEWNILSMSERIGYGEQAFQRASKALLDMSVHRAAGFRVNREGTLIQLGIGPTQNPVSTLYEGKGIPGAELEQFNHGAYFPSVKNTVLVYGTLPRHIESGEEAFIVTMNHEEEVIAHLVAFSRHQWVVAKLASPLASFGQKMMTKRYVQALARAAEGKLV